MAMDRLLALTGNWYDCMAVTFCLLLLVGHYQLIMIDYQLAMTGKCGYGALLYIPVEHE